jgi:hypothetical protein
MVAVAIDGPLRKDDVGFLLGDDPVESRVSLCVDYGLTIDLSPERRASLQDPAGLLRLGSTYRRAVIGWRCAAVPVTTIEIEKHDLMTRTSESAQSSPRSHIPGRPDDRRPRRSSTESEWVGPNPGKPQPRQ